MIGALLLGVLLHILALPLVLTSAFGAAWILAKMPERWSGPIVAWLKR